MLILQSARSGQRRPAAQGNAQAAATWRSPQDGEPTVRGVERLHAIATGKAALMRALQF